MDPSYNPTGYPEHEYGEQSVYDNNYDNDVSADYLAYNATNWQQPQDSGPSVLEDWCSSPSNEGPWLPLNAADVGLDDIAEYGGFYPPSPASQGSANAKPIDAEAEKKDEKKRGKPAKGSANVKSIDTETKETHKKRRWDTPNQRKKHDKKSGKK